MAKVENGEDPPRPPLVKGEARSVLRWQSRKSKAEHSASYRASILIAGNNLLDGLFNKCFVFKSGTVRENEGSVTVVIGQLPV
jgi:hypothetical protein